MSVTSLGISAVLAGRVSWVEVKVLAVWRGKDKTAENKLCRAVGR